jgi:hypothetical protein
MTTRRYLFAIVDGGGNVPPELGVARRLVERGHLVTVLAEVRWLVRSLPPAPGSAAGHTRRTDPIDELSTTSCAIGSAGIRGNSSSA